MIILRIFLVICTSIQILVLLRIGVDLLPVRYNNSLFRFIFEASESFLKYLKKYIRIPLVGYVNLAPLLAILIILSVELIFIKLINIL